jgi:hypothetical protein
MRNRVLTLAAAAAVLFAMSSPAKAQTTTTEPTFELSAGYQLLRALEVCFDEDDEESCSEGATFPFGVAVDAVRNFGALGVVGEVGWSRDSEDFTGGSGSFDAIHIAGGVRWTGRRNPRVWPYGQVLLGVQFDRVSQEFDDEDLDELAGFSETDPHFMLQPGAGVNFVIGDGLGAFAQVDWRRAFLDEEEFGISGRNFFRVFLGLRMILD